MSGELQPRLELAAEEVDLVGDGNRLRGQLFVRNLEDRRVLLRSAQLRDHDLPAVGPDGASDVPVTVAAVLPAKRGQTVKIMVQVDPRTPPGDYTGKLLIADQLINAVLHVTELVKPRISPSRLVIREQQEDCFIKRVYIANDGNVPISVGDTYRVRLGEEIQLSESPSGAVESDDPLARLSAVLVGKRQIRGMKDVGVAEVRNRSGSFELKPGETRVLDLEIFLPGELDEESRFEGKLRFCTTDVDLVVLPISRRAG